MTVSKSLKKEYTITKDDIISIIGEKHPKVLTLLCEYGLNCINCPFGQFETIELGAKIHGMNDQEIEKMLNEINEELKDKYNK